MTYAEFSREGIEKLSKNQVECGNIQTHVQDILRYACGRDLHELAMDWHDKFPCDGSLDRARSVLAKRLEGIPLQYISRECGFWKSTFHVGPGVLIPRPETELLVEKVLSCVADSSRVAELGAGSGNIGISALLDRPDLSWHGYELSEESFAYLQVNCRRLLGKQQTLYQPHLGDFFHLAQKQAPFDAIVSNPPYVAKGEIPTLSVEVRNEPLLALSGGEKGFDVIEKLVSASPYLLKKGGVFLCEIGEDQASVVSELLLQTGFSEIECFRDLNDRDRVIKGVR